MFNCFYNEEIICSLDLKNEYGVYDRDLKLSWRLASRNGELMCIDCGEKVILNAGDIKVPYFSHIKGSNRTCELNNFVETENHINAKVVLYNFLKAIGFDRIYITYSHKNKRYSDLFVEDSNNKLAFEYVRHDMKLDEWISKDAFYKENNIKCIWLLNYDWCNEYKNMCRDIEDIIHKTYGKIYYFNLYNNSITIKKDMCFYLENSNTIFKREWFQKDYFLKDIKVDIFGDFVTDFNNVYSIQLKKFIQDQEKIEYFKKEHKNNMQYNKSVPRKVYTFSEATRHNKYKEDINQITQPKTLELENYEIRKISDDVKKRIEPLERVYNPSYGTYEHQIQYVDNEQYIYRCVIGPEIQSIKDCKDCYYYRGNYYKSSGNYRYISCSAKI